MVTRKEIRGHEKKINFFFEFNKISKHFFKDMNDRLKKVEDPRHQSYITYGSELMLFMIIMKNACNTDSMRDMTDKFNMDECIENMRMYFKLDTLEELPHYDIINNFLSALNPEELGEIRTYMIKQLLKKRCFEQFRINGKYWGIIVDGTGLFTFDEKHCEHCLRREYKNEETGEIKVIYMHHVLEAKLVVGDMVLSLDSEFIENESEDTPKQDCELNAFYRLAKRIKDTYKRLPICILGDSLYACQGVFTLCEENKWKYLLRFKEGRIKSIMDEFRELKKMEKDDKSNDISWINDINYNSHDVNLFECILETEKNEERKFTFISNIKVTHKKAQGLVDAGRSRWKIENEGFNKQKNIRYYIEHANSHHYTAMKNHYLLTQITDILMQLFEKGAKVLKKFKNKAKEISSNLLEAIRTRVLTDEDMKHMVIPIQVRFT
ncbi:transposase family protein [Virgibacillus sp. W0181]|uniref:transposase family protein n=1 Tax=Virgibacillus sp. W0181 TaxID=3391581 RepID=UPI003F47A5C3